MKNNLNQELQSDQENSSDALAAASSTVQQPLPTPEDTADTGTKKEQETVPASNSNKFDIKSNIGFADSTHEYIREYIKLADQKATFFFAVSTAILAFLYKNGVSARWLKPIMSWNVLDMISFIAMVALAIGSFLSLLVVIPRNSGSRRGFLFWEAIAEFENGRQYSDDLSTLTPGTLFQIKAEHCFDLSKVCRRKYHMLKFALWISAVGLCAALIVFLFL